MEQIKWVIFFVVLLVLSINPIYAVEMGIETDINSSLNQGTGKTIENNSNENGINIPVDAIESPTIMPDNYHKGAVEPPSVYINPSHNDIEGYHTETHSYYSQDLDPWPAILFIADIVTTVITITAATRAGITAYRILIAKRELLRIGRPLGFEVGANAMLIQMTPETAPLIKIIGLMTRESEICIKMGSILKISILLTIITSIGVINSIHGNKYNSWTH